MAIGGVVIQMKADADQAIRETRKFAKSLGVVDKESKGLGTTLKKGLAVGAVAAGTAIAGAGAALVQFGKAAAEDFRSAQKLEEALRGLDGVTEDMIRKNADYIASMELATSISDEELRPAMANLALATGDVGEAQDLMAASADIAALSGKNFSTVAEAMAKAAAGQTTQLKRLAPWLDENKDGTLSLKEATKGLGDEYVDAAEKAAANDPWTQIGVIWGNMQEALGQYLIPFIQTFGDWFADKKNQQRIQELTQDVADFSKEVGEKAVAAVKDLWTWLGSDDGQRSMKSFADGMASIATALGAVAKAFRDIRSAYDRLPQWFKDLQGKAFSFLGNASLPGVASRLFGDDDAPTGPTRTQDDPTPRGGPGSITNITVNTTGATTERAIGIALRAERAALG